MNTQHSQTNDGRRYKFLFAYVTSLSLTVVAGPITMGIQTIVTNDYNINNEFAILGINILLGATIGILFGSTLTGLANPQAEAKFIQAGMVIGTITILALDITVAHIIFKHNHASHQGFMYIAGFLAIGSWLKNTKIQKQLEKKQLEKIIGQR